MAKLTLEQIGTLAGVSRSTVSRVVNDHPSVKPEVRDRVRQVIVETGYHPDPAARSLASRRSKMIGLIVPQSAQFLFTDPYFPRLIQGISRACNRHEYILSLLLFQTPEEEAKFYPRLRQNQLFDGLLITAAEISDLFLRQLIDKKVPFVLIGRPSDPSKINFVDVDNVAGAYSAVTHLIRLGYQRIATITGPLNTTASLDRRAGYLQALQEHGLGAEPAWETAGDYSEVSGYEAMKRLLPHQPEAVFVASDAMALGALQALREAGCSVPDDIAVVGFDDLPLSATANPPLTTVRQPIRRVGEQAVETLLGLLSHGEPRPPHHLVMSTQLVIRASCGATFVD